MLGASLAAPTLSVNAFENLDHLYMPIALHPYRDGTVKDGKPVAAWTRGHVLGPNCRCDRNKKTVTVFQNLRGRPVDKGVGGICDGQYGEMRCLDAIQNGRSGLWGGTLVRGTGTRN